MQTKVFISPFIDILCERFLALVRTVLKSNNEKMHLLLSYDHFETGLIRRNLNFIAHRWKTSVDSLLSENYRHCNDATHIDRVHIIKEETVVLEGTMLIDGFDDSDIRDFLFCISTF